MKQIKRKYVLDENQNKVAVQIDIEDFEKIEEVLEDYALGKLMEENDSADDMNQEDAKTFYNRLEKND